MNRQRRRANAPFCAEKGQNFSRIVRTGYTGRPALVETRERIGEFVRVKRFTQKFAVPRSHGAQQQVRIGGGRESQNRDLVVKTVAQTFSRLQCEFRIL